MRKLTEMKCEKDSLSGFKVIQDRRIVTNRKGTGDFLLVINSNLGRSFRATVTSQKIAYGIRLSHLTPSLGMIPCEYAEPYVAWNYS